MAQRPTDFGSEVFRGGGDSISEVGLSGVPLGERLAEVRGIVVAGCFEADSTRMIDLLMRRFPDVFQRFDYGVSGGQPEAGPVGGLDAGVEMLGLLGVQTLIEDGPSRAPFGHGREDGEVLRRPVFGTDLQVAVELMDAWPRLQGLFAVPPPFRVIINSLLENENGTAETTVHQLSSISRDIQTFWDDERFFPVRASAVSGITMNLSMFLFGSSRFAHEPDLTIEMGYTGRQLSNLLKGSADPVSGNKELEDLMKKYSISILDWHRLVHQSDPENFPLEPIPTD